MISTPLQGTAQCVTSSCTSSNSKAITSNRVVYICEHVKNILRDFLYTATIFYVVEIDPLVVVMVLGRALRVDVKRVPNSEGMVETALRTLHFRSSSPTRSSSYNTTPDIPHYSRSF